jgi:hypothetical protein
MLRMIRTKLLDGCQVSESIWRASGQSLEDSAEPIRLRNVSVLGSNARPRQRSKSKVGQCIQRSIMINIYIYICTHYGGQSAMNGMTLRLHITLVIASQPFLVITSLLSPLHTTSHFGHCMSLPWLPLTLFGAFAPAMIPTNRNN